MKYVLLSMLFQEYNKLPKLHSILNYTQLNTIVICFIIPQIHLLLFLMMFENSFWKWVWLNGCMLH